jgi:hypothetical protein
MSNGVAGGSDGRFTSKNQGQMSKVSKTGSNWILSKRNQIPLKEIKCHNLLGWTTCYQKGKTHLAGRWASASFTPDLLADVGLFLGT